jgi:hypothetical protein
VLLSTPLHASSNFTVSVQLANKRGFKQKISLSILRVFRATIYWIEEQIVKITVIDRGGGGVVNV